MSPWISAALIVLPYLAVNATGLVISVRRVRLQKQPALMAAYAYGTIVLLILIIMLLNLWTASAVANDMAVMDTVRLVAESANVRKCIYAVALATLVAGVFIGRKATNGSFTEPMIIVGVSLLCKVQEFYPYIPSNWAMLGWVAGLAGSIGILVALYGWRNDAELLSQPPKVQEVVMATAPQDNAAKEPAEPKGMFKEEDYIPFVAGVIILAGLFVVPFVYSGIMSIYYPQALLPSVISCGVFIYAHTKTGYFSVGKFVIGYFLVWLMMQRAALHSQGTAQPMFLALGILGILLMFGCGWIGIVIARSIRRRMAK